MSWPTEWSPTTIEMYNEYLKIANVCERNFNDDHGFEISGENDKNFVNLSTEAMEPPPLVKLVGRPSMKGKRDKGEALKRQSKWVALRRGRVMTCSTYDVLDTVLAIVKS
ncbi:hypothetical protein HAX54_012102 [Datura stramonium]|uniref:Uncharacterized protein n=1 Tax=Datura stramonium TaxID=4076 RepID=A0ABS8RJ15_DATST|nr:hypothetical protein [Datura stramonium]